MMVRALPSRMNIITTINNVKNKGAKLSPVNTNKEGGIVEFPDSPVSFPSMIYAAYVGTPEI